MKKDTGLTLIEVLASVVVLAVAILAITMVLQQTASSSRSNAVTDRSVQITRSVLEELKNNMLQSTNMQQSTIPIFSQNVNIQQLRDYSPPQTTIVYYPNSDDRQYRLDIRSLAIENAKFQLLDKNHDLNDHFRRISVTCTNIKNNRSYELEALVEYN